MRAVALIALTTLLAASQAYAGDANNPVLDNSTERVASCVPSEMEKAADGLVVFSSREEESICEIADTSLGHMPETGVLRALLKSSFLIGHDNETNSKDEAYQLMNIVEARDQSDPEKIKKTFELAYRVNHVTTGHVTPKDLNIFLRNAGEMAKTLSDDGLTSMSFVIWEMKKRNGE